MGWFGDAIKGGMGGAAAGAPIGPGGALVGGGIGALLGGLGGLFGGGNPEGQQQRDMLMALAQSAQSRGLPANAAYSDFRGDQQDYLARVKALSEGKGPSMAREMTRNALMQSSSNQAAAAAGARGNPALAARQAANNMAGLSAQATQAGALAGAQEQLGALQQWGSGIYGARGQDEGMNRFNSELALRGLQQNDMTQIQALQAALQAGQVAGQQPTSGDYLMGAGGALGQILALARQQQQQGQGQKPASGPSIYGTQYGPLA